MEKYKTGRWSSNELDMLKELYGKVDIEELVCKLNRSKASIHIKANRTGNKYPEKYTYNKDYFERIDSPDKAYWLGFIYADGCVVRDRSRRMSEFTIKLKSSDDAHLKKLNDCMDGNVNITYTKKSPFIHKGYDKEYESCNIRFYSTKLVDDLIDKGVIQNKTNKLEFPRFLDDELVWHFIRGFMDGDGHLCVPRKNERYGYRVGFTCNCRNFLESIREIFIYNNIKSHINEDGNSFKLDIRERQSVKNFIDRAYVNASMYLDRKYVNYLILNELLSPLEIAG